MITGGTVTGIQYNGYWSSIGFCDSVILGDSVTAVYFQPGIETETSTFRSYIEELIEIAYNEALLNNAGRTRICLMPGSVRNTKFR